MKPMKVMVLLAKPMSEEMERQIGQKSIFMHRKKIVLYSHPPFFHFLESHIFHPIQQSSSCVPKGLQPNWKLHISYYANVIRKNVCQR